MSDTSLVFNLVARDNTEQGLSSARERFDTAATGIGAGVAAALGVSLAQEINTDAANAKLAAQLSLGPQEAADVAKVSASVYQNAWGDSVDTVNLAIKGVYQNIGDTSAAEGGLEGVTTKVTALAETFDQDLTMATAAAGQMVRTGLADNVDEALDILAAGLGTAADKSGDLLETFNEYSTQFRRLGIDGQTATGLISQGLENGARDADQVADALGQFGERALAGGTAVDTAYKSIGLSASDMAKMIGAGGDSAEQALSMTLDALRGTTDEQTRLNAAAALFGDPANVMGDALYALDPATAAAASGMDKADGAADRLTETMGDSAAKSLERFKRQALGKLGEVTGGFVSFAMDNQAVFEPLAYTLAGLAATVLVVRGAMMTYSAISTVVTAAHTVMTASTWGVIGGWLRMNAVGLGVYLRLGAAATLSALRTAAAWTGSALVSIGTWILAVIRAGVTAAVQFTLMAARAVAWAAVMAAQWLIAMGPIGWIILAVAALVALIVVYWDQIKAWTLAAWNWVVDKLIWAKDMMINAFMNFTLIGLLIKHWSSIKSTAASWWNALVTWIKGVPGRIYNLWLNWTLAGLIVKHWQSAKQGTITKANEMIAYVRGLPGRIKSGLGNLGSLLWNSGSALISGFINGIKSRIGSVRDAASDIVSAARDFFPFSPAKTGPFSGRGYTSYSGQALVEDFQQGIAGRIPALRAELDAMPGVAPQSVQPAPLGLGMAPVLGMAAGGGTARVILDVRGADEDWKRLLRKMIRVDGRGSADGLVGRR
ncbi:phage tail tape measure protein [Streptomyces sp. NPDC051051]|uniref:phage tail tape measure protein n=1 Tax=Streptomyces sp. NPDC051051 TaxID=3155666 RepID=UPI00343148EF